MAWALHRAGLEPVRSAFGAAPAACYRARVLATQAEDGELVAQIAAGAASARVAEAELCRRFGPRIRLYGLRHLRHEERARDLVQMVLARVLLAARAGGIEEPDKLARFVLGTCRNTALRMHRDEARSEPVPDEVLAALPATSEEPLDLRGLMRCFDQLDARAKIVLTLSFQEERPAEQIAEKLATTPGNVRVLRHRAVLALRECLDRHEVQP